MTVAFIAMGTLAFTAMAARFAMRLQVRRRPAARAHSSSLP